MVGCLIEIETPRMGSGRHADLFLLKPQPK
jgi:hypothetical protein